jgi:hypothetical protein
MPASGKNMSIALGIKDKLTVGHLSNNGRESAINRVLDDSTHLGERLAPSSL